MSNQFIPPDIAAFSAPLLLGHLFNWGLFGTLTVQVYIYYMAFPNDNQGSKFMVFGIYIIEFVQTMLATHDAFGALGSGWGHPAALRDPQWLWLSVPVFSGFISCTVQMFFAYRIWRLSKVKFLGGLVALLAITQGVAGIVQGVEALQIGDLSKLQTDAFVSAAIWLGGSALCDVLIASCMIFYLSRGQSAFRATNVLLTRLIRLTIETGMITATVATVDLILFLVFKQNNYHICPALTLAKFYSNNLLVLFNSRVRFVNGRNEAVMQPGNATNIASWNNYDKGIGSRDYHPSSRVSPRETISGINVEVSREVHADGFAMVGMGDVKVKRDSSSEEIDVDDMRKLRGLQNSNPQSFMNV